MVLRMHRRRPWRGESRWHKIVPRSFILHIPGKKYCSIIDMYLTLLYLLGYFSCIENGDDSDMKWAKIADGFLLKDDIVA